MYSLQTQKWQEGNVYYYLIVYASDLIISLSISTLSKYLSLDTKYLQTGVWLSLGAILQSYNSSYESNICFHVLILTEVVTQVFTIIGLIILKYYIHEYV